MNTQTPVQKFEAWCIIEMFGHSQMAGLVTEQTFGPATFFKVSVPETSTQPAFDRLINPSSIYAINPVDEATAKYKAEQLQFKPVQAWDVRKMMEIQQPLPNKPTQQITAGQDRENNDGQDDWDDEEEEPEF